MRRTAARLNRSWLAVIGLVLLIAGLVGLGVQLQLWQQLLPGLAVTWPSPGNPLLGDAGWLDAAWFPAVAAALGVVLALLGVLWLVAQVPRRDAAKPFRLHDSAADGLTRCAPGVVTDAVEAQVEAVPGVRSASAVLRGSATNPDLTVRVAVSDDADLVRLLTTLDTDVASDVGTALDTRLARLGVVVDVDRGSSRSPKAVSL
jgi:hypothetical protein